MKNPRTKSNSNITDKKALCQYFVQVKGLDHKGQGQVFIDNIAYSVPNTVTGDTIIVTQKKSGRNRKKRQLKVMRFVHRKYKRIHPFCLHNRYCGGCDRQEFSYYDQLQLKQTMLHDLFAQYDLLYHCTERDIIPCDTVYYYRNKIDYSFSTLRWILDTEIHNEDALDRRALGLHVKGFYDRVVHLEQCFLHPSNALRNSFDSWARQNNVSYYNDRKHNGLLRTLTLRSSLCQKQNILQQKEDILSKHLEHLQGHSSSTVHVTSNPISQCMGILSIAEYEESFLNLLQNYLQEQQNNSVLAIDSTKHTDISHFSSFYVTINSKKNDDILNLNMLHVYGDTYITEQCGHIRLRIYPKVFYQTNSRQAETLYRCIRDVIMQYSPKIILDVYCGIGSIGLFLAQDVQKVVGIDIVSESIQAAKENARINNIHNAEFICSSAEILLEHKNDLPLADALIVDPPRSGLHQSVLQFLKEYGARTLVYVSCNPFTMVRDIAALASHYTLNMYQPVDMFPHTAHVEVVAQLVRRLE